MWDDGRLSAYRYIDAYTMESAMEIVEKCGVRQLAWMLPRMPVKLPPILFATASMIQGASYIHRVMGP